MAEIEKTARIEITIGFDEQKLPVEMHWHTTDLDSGEPVPCKAMLLSLFDRETLDTLKIDLWTKDMQVVEMDRFFFQTLRAMADTYKRATSNKDLANDMQRFVQYFGEKTEILKKEE